jgi:hypothetical protein
MIENIEELPKRTLENGQILFEIEPNIWVDYETYKPKPKPEEVALDGSE